MKKKLLKILISLMILIPLKAQYFQNIVEDTKYFKKESKSEKIKINFKNSKKNKKFTIWGWFKNDSSDTTLTNIFSINKNVKKLSSSKLIKRINDKNFSKCLYTKSYLELNPSLYRDKEIINNPNCLNFKKEIILDDFSEKIFFLNHKLENDLKTYSLFFFFQNGIDKEKKSEMFIKEIKNIIYEENVWVYFAISFDYLSTNFNIYIKSFNLKIPFEKNMVFNIINENFFIGDEILFILNDKQKNKYFLQESSYVGEIAFFSTIDSISNNLNFLWISFISKKNLFFEGLILEINGNYKEKELNTNGLINKYFKIENKSESDIKKVKNFDIINKINSLENKKPYFHMNINNWINFEKVDFTNKKMIKSFSFFFDFSYKEDLPTNYNFLLKGKKSEKGSIEINLVKKNKNDTFRYINIQIVGTGDLLGHTFENKILPDKKIWVLIGISISPANSIICSYYDSLLYSENVLLENNFFFNFSQKEVKIFKNDENKDNRAGFIELYRFMILNNNPFYVYNEILMNIDSADNKDDCQIFHSGYKKNGICLKCKNLVLNEDKVCDNYCERGTFNLSNGICLNCKDHFCSDFKTTEFHVKQIDENSFKIFFDNSILNLEPEKYKDYFIVKIDGIFDKNSYDYNLTYIDQVFTYDFDFKKDLKKKILSFSLNPKNNILFDIKRNLIYTEKKYINLTNTCFISKTNKNMLNILSYFTTIILLLTILILLIITVFFSKKINDILSLWKIILLNYLKHQLISFFVLTGIELPCEIYFFLSTYYNFFVRFFKYEQILSAKEEFKGPQSKQFIQEGVSRIILDNFAYGFLFHILLFIFYVIFNLLSRVTKNSFLKKYINYYNYFFMVFGYVVLFLHCILFSFLNIKENQFGKNSNTSFFIALCYFFIFVIYFIYNFMLVYDFEKDLEKKQKRSIFIFLIGHNDNKKSRIFDFQFLFLFFLIALFLATLYNFALLQSVFIFVILLLMVIFLILQRPWIYTLFNISEIISFSLFSIGYLFLIIVYLNDNFDCEFCAQKKMFFSYIIIFLFFLGLLISSFFSLFLIIYNFFRPYNFCHLHLPENYLDCYENDLNFKNNDKKLFSSNKIISKKSLSKEKKKKSVIDLKNIYNKQNSVDLFINKVKNSNSDRKMDDNLFGNFIEPQNKLQKDDIQELEIEIKKKNDSRKKFSSFKINNENYKIDKNLVLRQNVYSFKDKKKKNISESLKKDKNNVNRKDKEKLKFDEIEENIENKKNFTNTNQKNLKSNLNDSEKISRREFDIESYLNELHTEENDKISF